MRLALAAWNSKEQKIWHAKDSSSATPKRVDAIAVNADVADVAARRKAATAT